MLSCCSSLKTSMALFFFQFFSDWIFRFENRIKTSRINFDSRGTDFDFQNKPCHCHQIAKPPSAYLIFVMEKKKTFFDFSRFVIIAQERKFVNKFHKIILVNWRRVQFFPGGKSSFRDSFVCDIPTVLRMFIIQNNQQVPSDIKYVNLRRSW